MFNMSVSGDFRKAKNITVHINKDIAKKLGQLVYNAFYDLVERTPQWSGYTAASWNIGYGTNAGSGRDVPSLKAGRKKKPAPHAAGHMQAVGMATMRSHREVEAYMNGGYTTGDLVVWNDSDQIWRMYHSDFRSPENAAAEGAIRDFELAVESKIIEIHLDI